MSEYVVEEVYPYVVEEAYPLEVVGLSESKSFTIELATAFGICAQAAVRDVGQNTTSYWSFVSNSWSGTGRVRPGAGNLGLSFQARNISGAGNLTLVIKDDTGKILTTQTIAAGSVGSANQYVQTTEVIVDMPDRAYTITCSVTP